MLWTLEREMHDRGHRTTVAACAGSQVAGQLFSTGEAPIESDTFEQRNLEHQQAIRELIRRERFDLIHDKSGSFFTNAENVRLPTLATVHLPRSFYGGIAWRALPSHVSLNCVSAAQAHTFIDVPNLEEWVQNGIAVERFPLTTKKNHHLLWLGRICEEKAPHLAIQVAQRTGKRLILAGQVYPFRYHQEYFAREVEPMLGDGVEFIESPSFGKKIELLSRASALLVPSLVDETSSLVALEAMACGTPIIAFRRGALPEIVHDGATGFLVNDVEEMAAAAAQIHKIQPEACRAHVEQHFTADRMARDYENLYRRVLSRSVGEAA
jgi:glycosyltransferase involved in cell wall biosynthesis